MKSRNDGEFLVWFCNRIFDLAKLFNAPIEYDEFAKGLPEVAASAFEIRNARLKMVSAYGKLAGMKDCLKHVDAALYQAERVIWQELKSRDERRKLWDELTACTCELGDIWSKVYLPITERQEVLKTYCLNSLHGESS